MWCRCGVRGATGDGDVMVIADCEAETRESPGLPPTSTRSPQLSRETTTPATGNITLFTPSKYE